MSARAPTPVRPGDEQFTVALQGFSEFERTALASFFRLAAERTPSYRQVQRVEDSQFIIADADHPTSLGAVLAAERHDDTVYIGHHAPEGATSWLRRPIEPTRIVRELDSLVALRRAFVPVSLATLAAEADHVSAHRGVSARSQGTGPETPRDALLAADFEPTMQPAVVVDRIEPLAMPVVTSRVPAARRPEAPVIEVPTGPEVLVVEDSRIARRFLQIRLQRLSYRVHLASDGDEALEQFTQRPFALVFLDVELGSLGSIDGFSLCQHIKQHPDFAGGKAPGVVIVTGLSGATDRVRGQLAGCDAYLTKPLLEAEFMKALHRLDPALRKRLPHGAGTV